METEIVFRDVSFRWFDEDDESVRPVFTGLNLALPHGVVSLVGQNGTGKSTLLALAAGSIVPDEGQVLVRGVDTRALRDERERQQHTSFVFQNMEFETVESIGELLAQVHAAGFHAVKRPQLLAELIAVFELEPVLGRRTQEVSKGELQRVILAFSLLYGSPILAMDEPIFALEDRQKAVVMGHLADLTRRGQVSVYYSVHELDISKEYSDRILLFSRESPPRIGPTAEVFTPEIIEKAYEVPFHFLKRKEELYRKYLVELLRVRGDG